MKYLVICVLITFSEKMMLTSTTPINVILANATSKPEETVNQTVPVPVKTTNTTANATVFTRKAAIYIEPVKQTSGNNLVQLPQKHDHSNCQEIDVIVKIWTLLSGFLNQEQKSNIPFQEFDQIQNVLSNVKNHFEELPAYYKNLRILDEIRSLSELLEKRKAWLINKNPYLNLLPENLKQPNCRNAILKFIQAVNTAYGDLINNPLCRGGQVQENVGNLNINKFTVDSNGALVPAFTVVTPRVTNYETNREEITINPDINKNYGFPVAYRNFIYTNGNPSLNSDNLLTQNFRKLPTNYYQFGQNVNTPHVGKVNPIDSNQNSLNLPNKLHGQFNGMAHSLENVNSYISNLQVNNQDSIIHNKLGLENTNVVTNQLAYNQQPYNFNNNLLNGNNINTNVNNGMNSVINSNKLDIPLENDRVLELTYLLKRSRPIVYNPVYYVKYRMPYENFLVKLREILSKKPDLKDDPNKLYQELIGASNITELSSDLKGYGKDQILQFIFNSGALVTAKIVDDATKLNENVPINLQQNNDKISTSVSDKFNNINVDKNSDEKDVNILISSQNINQKFDNEENLGRANEVLTNTIPLQQSGLIPQNLMNAYNYYGPRHSYPYGNAMNVNQPVVKNVDSHVLGQGLDQTVNSHREIVPTSLSNYPHQMANHPNNFADNPLSTFPENNNLIGMNTLSIPVQHLGVQSESINTYGNKRPFVGYR